MYSRNVYIFPRVNDDLEYKPQFSVYTCVNGLKRKIKNFYFEYIYQKYVLKCCIILNTQFYIITADIQNKCCCRVGPRSNKIIEDKKDRT
jgi:hypothetical protein